MKVRAKVFFNKARHAREKILINGAKDVTAALKSLAILLEGSKAARVDITISERRRLTQ